MHIQFSSDNFRRKEWEILFKQMAENGDDKLVIPDFAEDIHEDWNWGDDKPQIEKVKDAQL